MPKVYEYQHCYASRVVDGDTVEMVIDFGYGLGMTTHLRLEGINTPEVRGEEKEAGLVVSQIVDRIISYLNNYTGEESSYYMTSSSKPKFYGRTVGKLFIASEDKDTGFTDLSTLLIEYDLGVAYFGGKKNPIPQHMLDTIVGIGIEATADQMLKDLGYEY